VEEKDHHRRKARNGCSRSVGEIGVFRARSRKRGGPISRQLRDKPLYNGRPWRIIHTGGLSTCSSRRPAATWGGFGPGDIGRRQKRSRRRTYADSETPNQGFVQQDLAALRSRGTPAHSAAQTEIERMAVSRDGLAGVAECTEIAEVASQVSGCRSC